MINSAKFETEKAFITGFTRTGQKLPVTAYTIFYINFFSSGSTRKFGGSSFLGWRKLGREPKVILKRLLSAWHDWIKTSYQMKS